MPGPSCDASPESIIVSAETVLVFCEKSDGSEAATWAGDNFAPATGGAGNSEARLNSGCDGRSMVGGLNLIIQAASIHILMAENQQDSSIPRLRNPCQVPGLLAFGSWLLRWHLFGLHESVVVTPAVGTALDVLPDFPVRAASHVDAFFVAVFSLEVCRQPHVAHSRTADAAVSLALVVA